MPLSSVFTSFPFYLSEKPTAESIRQPSPSSWNKTKMLSWCVISLCSCSSSVRRGHGMGSIQKEPFRDTEVPGEMCPPWLTTFFAYTLHKKQWTTLGQPGSVAKISQNPTRTDQTFVLRFYLSLCSHVVNIHKLHGNFFLSIFTRLKFIIVKLLENERKKVS